MRLLQPLMDEHLKENRLYSTHFQNFKLVIYLTFRIAFSG